MWAAAACPGRLRRCQGHALGVRRPAACSARLLGLTGWALWLGPLVWVRGASLVSRGRRHVCARFDSTRELGVPCYLYWHWALGLALHSCVSCHLWSFGFGLLLLGRPAGLPGPLGFRSLGSRVGLSGRGGRCCIVYELPRAGP